MKFSENKLTGFICSITKEVIQHEMVVVGQWWQVTEHILSSDFDLEMLHTYKLFAGISFNVRSHMKKKNSESSI